MSGSSFVGHGFQEATVGISRLAARFVYLKVLPQPAISRPRHNNFNSFEGLHLSRLTLVMRNDLCHASRELGHIAVYELQSTMESSALLIKHHSGDRKLQLFPVKSSSPDEG